MKSNLQSIIKGLPKNKNTITIYFKTELSLYSVGIYIKNHKWTPKSTNTWPIKYNSRKKVLYYIKFCFKKYTLHSYKYDYSIL
jgi:hypothetical protein